MPGELVLAVAGGKYWGETKQFLNCLVSYMPEHWAVGKFKRHLLRFSMLLTLPKLSPQPVPLKTRVGRLFRFYTIAQLVALYAIFSPLFGMQIYNRLLFIPYRVEKYDFEKIFDKIDEATNSKFSQLTISSGTSEKLDVWYFKKAGAKKLFIVSHGNGGNMANRIVLVPELLTANGSVLMYDYEGFGRSTGEPSVPNVKRDGLAVFDYARDTMHYEPKDIIVYGESLGSGVAVETARHRPVGGIVIQSGFTSLVHAAQYRLPFLRIYPTFFFYDVDLDNITFLRGKHAPLLWLHGEKDETLPVFHADEAIAAASPLKKLVKFPGAGHNDIYMLHPKLFAATIADYIRTLP